MEKTNFYQHFIQGFSKIAIPFTLILKTNSSANLSASLTKIVVEYDKVDDSDSCNNNSNKKFAF